jgi:hypothetical protein
VTLIDLVGGKHWYDTKLKITPDWIDLVLMAEIALTDAVAFYQFILEEAIQSGVMGCYLARQQNKPILSVPILDQLENHTIPALKKFNQFWGHLAFWCQPAFDDFRKAAEMSVRIYRATL